MKSGFRIGSLELADKLLLAPMAGITNLPVRLLARRQGAALCYTEMVSVNGLVRDGAKSFALMKSSPEDRPLAVQLFGDDPEVLARGAELSAGYADLIDINMGCPVKKVVASGAGSALLQDPERVRGIIRAVRKATSLPLTVKIRSGWGGDAINFLLVGKIAEDEGVDAVTLHPRTRAQMFEGRSDWQQIAALKKALAIPVIGSGDLFTPADIVAMFAETGCDAVMAARGAMGNPWIFSGARALLTGLPLPAITMADRRAVATEHLHLLVADAGEAVAVREMRKHLCWYAKGVAGAAHFRGEVNRMDSMEEMEQAINTFFNRDVDES